MDAKVAKTFWRDPEFEEEPPEVKLAAIWAVSNADVDVCGVFRYSARAFKFDTNAEPSVFERLLEVSSSFVRFDSGMVWCKNWIRYQIGDGESLSRNNMSRVVQRQLDKLPDEVRKAVIDRYPSLMATPKPKKEPNRKATGEYQSRAADILNHLNKVAGTEFMPVESNLTLISQRLKETKGDVEGIIVMLNRQWESWKDTEHQQYYRPKTLFNKSNFANYYGARNTPVHRSGESLKSQLDEVEGRIIMHPANKKSAAYNPHCTADQMRELHGLEMKREALRRQING